MVNFEYAVRQLSLKLARVGREVKADDDFDAAMALVGMAIEESMSGISRSLTQNFDQAKANKSLKWQMIVKPVISVTGGIVKQYQAALEGSLAPGTPIDTHVHLFPTLLRSLVDQLRRFAADLSTQTLQKLVEVKSLRVLDTAEVLLSAYPQFENALRALRMVKAQVALRIRTA